MMYARRQIHRQLFDMGIAPADTILLHSSLKAIMPVEGGAEGFLDALCEYLRDGLLVLPTHTWSTVNAQNPVFTHSDTASCVGMLPEIFRRRPGVVRSKHPTHSLAAFGRDAQAFLEGHERFNTPCARQSPYGRLVDRDAFILLAGCALTCNTFVHGVEEWAGVPARLTEHEEVLHVLLADGSMLRVPSRRHMNSVSHQYDRLDVPLTEHGMLRHAQLGNAPTFCMRARDVCEVTMAILGDNPGFFSPQGR